jgi:hypothetical protein
MSFFPSARGTFRVRAGTRAGSLGPAGWLAALRRCYCCYYCCYSTDAGPVRHHPGSGHHWLAGWLAGWKPAWQWHQRWAPDGRLSWAVKSRRGVGSHLVGGANCRRYCRLARAARGRSGKCDSGSRLCAAGGRCESPSVRQSASQPVCRPTGTMMTHNIEPNY